MNGLQALVDAGHDPVAIVLARAQQRRLETFISFRLNEVHGVDTPDKYPYSLIISRFWRAHPEWHIGRPGAPLSPLQQQILGPRTSPVVGTWLPGGLDFAVPEVRQRRLDQIRECCERYDIDGLDLDFQRFPAYFKYGHEQQHRATMTACERRGSGTFFRGRMAKPYWPACPPRKKLPDPGIPAPPADG